MDYLLVIYGLSFHPTHPDTLINLYYAVISVPAPAFRVLYHRLTRELSWGYVEIFELL